MREEMTEKKESSSTALISGSLQERDKQMLQDIAHRLLAHGSLLRSRASERVLYDWSVEHFAAA